MAVIWIIVIWLVGIYLQFAIRRPKKDIEEIRIILWPIVYGVYYLSKLADIIHTKYWSWQALRIMNKGGHQSWSINSNGKSEKQ